MNKEEVEISKSLISSGRITEAIGVLLQTSDIDLKLKSQLISLSARQSELNKKAISGDISFSELNICQNQIVAAVLEFYNVLNTYNEKNNIVKQTHQEIKNKRHLDVLNLKNVTPSKATSEKSLSEMISILEDRAKEISQELSKEKKKNGKVFLVQFKEHHEKMLDSLNNSDLVRAHEINNRIQKLKHDLGYSRLVYTLPFVVYSATRLFDIIGASLIGGSVAAVVTIGDDQRKTSTGDGQQIETKKKSSRSKKK